MGRRLEDLCALESRLANAPLVGTAPRVDAWLLLEYAHSWGNKAFEESQLPQAVQHLLSKQVSGTPNARLQLIKHRSSDIRSEVTFAIVLSREVNPVSYTFKFPHYEALLDLDLTGVVSEAPRYEPHITRDPIYLVCTNGRRDVCCSSRGSHVYESLSTQVGRSVWQTTHVGGHRFAANLVCLPHGIYYGRVDDIEPADLVRAYRQKHLFTPALRGRCCYDPVVQAAESFLHAQNSELALDHYRLSHAERTAPDEWTISFAGLGGKLYRLAVTIHVTGNEVRASCGSEQRESLTFYHLKEYTCNDYR